MPMCAPWVDNPIGRRQIVTSGTRPTGSLRYVGAEIYETDTARIWTWNGSAWVPTGGSAPRCSLYRSGTQTISDTTLTALTWDSEYWDSDTLHSTSSNTSRITIPTGLGGIWQFTYTCTFAGFGVGERQTFLQANGWGRRFASHDQAPSSGSGCQNTSTCAISLAAGDFIEVWCYQNSGGALFVNSNGVDHFDAVRIGAS